MSLAKATGRKDFHVSAMRLSYRIRGNVARTHTNRVAKAVVFRIIRMSAIKVMFRLKKIVAVNRLITRMLVYSAMKINANSPLLYSTLKPETNSDSPSAKSKGVRLVSARLVINHSMHTGRIRRLIQVICIIEIWVKSKDLGNMRALSKIKLMLTSYEIVCATPRSAPRRAYLELEHQPARKVVYTFRLDTDRKYNTPNNIK